MAERNFMALLQAKWAEGKFVCVGLDSEFGKIPKPAHRSGNECEVSVPNTVVAFNRAIVEMTKDLVCTYKPNAAFYEAYGAEGIAALHRTIADIHAIAPDVPVILDAKRADIGNTNAGYVNAVFGFLQADAITVHPYLGAEALQPFLKRADKGVIILCRTSNPGAGEFQDLDITVEKEEANFLLELGGSWRVSADGYHAKFYQHVAYRVTKHWNKNNNCSLVVGATYPFELERVRKIVGDMPILIPGIGAQGGDLEKTVQAGKDSRGQGMIINSSRGIIFTSNGPDFAEAARCETQKLHDAITQCLAKSKPVEA